MAGYLRSYTAEEDNLILYWIVKSELFYELRGKIFWVDLANTEIFESDRTWQSLKNRFNRSILPDIFNPRFTLPDEDKTKVVLAWKQTAVDYDSNESSDSDSSEVDNDSNKGQSSAHESEK